MSVASFRERFTDFRSYWVVFVHVVLGVLVVSSSSPRGKKENKFGYFSFVVWFIYIVKCLVICCHY